MLHKLEPETKRWKASLELTQLANFLLGAPVRNQPISKKFIARVSVLNPIGCFFEHCLSIV
jgi:hypothetical protein